MTVNELIQVLQTMPPGAQVVIGHDNVNEFSTPHPEQEWNDHAENYMVVL